MKAVRIHHQFFRWAGILAFTILLGWIVVHRQEQRVERIKAEVESRLTSVEMLWTVERTDIVPVQLWHYLSFLQRPEVRAIRLLTDQGSVIFETSVTQAHTIDVGSVVLERPIRNRGFPLAILSYEIDRWEVLRQAVTEDFSYLAAISVLVLFIWGLESLSAREERRAFSSAISFLTAKNGDGREYVSKLRQKSGRLRNPMLASLFGRFIEILDEHLSLADQFAARERDVAVARTTQMLAHDVRKPFSMLRIGLAALQQEASPEERQRTVLTVSAEVDRALASVNGLIADVMEIGTTREPVREATSPESLVEAAVNDVCRIRQQADVTFAYDFRHKHMANVENTKMLRVFSNIIENAFQAMKYKGRMWFKTREIEENDAVFIEFCVGNGDTVIGPDDIPQLFEAFFSKGKKGGTGLGLAIAKKIVMAHGGKIWCTSSAEAGTEFWFTLPTAGTPSTTTATLPKTSSEVIATQATPLTTSSSGNADETALESGIVDLARRRGRKLRVLLIDDESIYVNALKAELERTEGLCGAVEVMTARGSGDALSAVAAAVPDLVVCDLDLGPTSLHGFELIKELRRKGFDRHICIHSNRSLPQDFRDGFAAGADTFFPKPMGRTHLLKLFADLALRMSQRPAPVSEPEIAVIDDDLFFLDHMKSALRGAKVHAYQSPGDFWSGIEADQDLGEKLSCVVTDYFLSDDDPGLNGLSFASEVKTRLRLPVVLCSGAEFTEIERAQVDGVLGKDCITWPNLRALIGEGGTAVRA